MRARSFRRAVGLTVLAVVAAAACSSSGSSKSSSTTTPGSSSGSAKLTASATGVTASTIRIGVTYPDLAALNKLGLIKIDDGDFAGISKALVDDINKHGGVGGRQLQLFTAKYSVLGNTEQLAVCTQMTQDNKVFMILGGFIGDNNLCPIQQYKTGVIFAEGAGFNQITLAKARAPFTTFEASDERSTEALVKILAQQGTLKGKTIGVYGTLSASKPLVDLTAKDLKDAGFPVKDTAINDAPATDTQAFNSQDKVIGSRFQNEGIDLVFVQVTVPPGANWDNIGYHPSMYAPQQSLVSSGAYTNPYGKFPVVGALAAGADPNLGYDSAAMKHCRDAYTAETGKTVLPLTEEQKTGKSTGFVALQQTCAELQMFVAAANKAGANLTPDTWLKGLESVGKIELALAPQSSFAPGKPDGQDSFQLVKFNPAYKTGSSVPEFIPVGAPITLGS
jgi:Periplasmic binding protein